MTGGKDALLSRHSNWRCPAVPEGISHTPRSSDPGASRFPLDRDHGLGNSLASALGQAQAAIARSRHRLFCNRATLATGPRSVPARRWHRQWSSGRSPPGRQMATAGATGESTPTICYALCP